MYGTKACNSVSLLWEWGCMVRTTLILRLGVGFQINAKACDDPGSHVSWDGVHASDAANLIVASAILLLRPSISDYSINQMCYVHLIYNLRETHIL